MHELSWKKEYEIGNPVVDREHKHLFDIALEAFKPVVPEERKKKIRDTIMHLNDYMKIHFKHEEFLMSNIEYPGLKHHKEVHKAIIQSIQTMIASLSTMPLKEFEKKLAFFVDSALVGHILEEDAKIQQWYDSKKGQRHIVNWIPDYIIGNKDLDEDHQLLFKLANDAFVKSEKGADKAELKKIMLELLSYFESHFEHEEDYMDEIGYPRLEHHEKIHDEILKTTSKLIKEMMYMDTKTFEFELALFVEKHLVAHILYEDMKIKHFLDGRDEMTVLLDDI